MAYDETASKLNVSGFLELAGNLSLPFQQFTATGTPTDGVATGVIAFAHNTEAIYLTIPKPKDSGQLLVLRDNSASGTAAHIITIGGAALLPGGYTEAEFNAPGEQLILMSKSPTEWVILLNSGSVTLR